MFNLFKNSKENFKDLKAWKLTLYSDCFLLFEKADYQIVPTPPKAEIFFKEKNINYYLLKEIKKLGFKKGYIQAKKLADKHDYINLVEYRIGDLDKI